MPLTEEAKRKKREREKANSQSIAKAINNKTVKAATDTTKAVSNTKGQPSLSKPKQDTLDRLNQKYGGGAKQDTVQKYTNKPASRRTNTQQRTEPAVSRNPRMLDTAQNVTPKQTTSQEREQRRTEAQRQKSGFNSMASEEAQRSARRALRNTPGVAKEALKQVGIGHGKTASDITAWNKSAAIGSKLDIKSTKFQEDIEKRRTASTKAAENAYKELSSAQERSEQRMQKMTKNAKGLEKAYYGALESGVGMISDQLLGPAWAASMLSRTYGNTRGQAQKEGATEAEDRAYSLLQGAKEVATEYAFRGIGLSSRLSGKMSLSPSEVLANAATRNMRGTAADLTHAGIRLLGGTAEENAEEVLGWAADPLISEFTYKKNVRSREAQEQLKKQSDSLRSKIGNEADARAMAAYLGSDDFIEANKKTYMDSGISEAEATDLAMQMREYLTASLSGDTKAMTDIEDKLSKKLAGKGLSAKSWSPSELMDTIASTTLLTMTTGLPGAAISSSQGAAFLQNNSSDAIRALANTAIDFEDKEMSMKAEAMRDRLDSGKEITSTQAFDLMHGAQEQYAKDSGRQLAAYQTADKTIKSDNLIAPRVMRGRDGAVTGDEVASETFAETANTAERNIRALVNKKDSAESLTDEEIDRGAQAVAGFKTGTFTIDDANELNYRNTAVRAAFEAETGIDLKQYIVTKSNGEVDIPATNAATKNALFAMAADNYVQTAKAETANWMDNTKGQVVSQISQRMGAKGTKALQESLDGVDERDRSEYMMTANATDMLYQAARNMGTEWDNVKADAVKLFPQISEQKLKTMYDAGLEDRAMAMDDARGQQIQLGEKVKLAKDNSNAPTGNLLIETSVPVKGTVARVFTELADNLGVDIHLVDSLETSTGKQANGQYIKDNIYINVNSDFEQNMGYIFMHETTHHLKVFAPEQYKELENLVREKWFQYDASQMQSEIAKKIDLYARNGQKLTEDEALEEIIADAAHEFLNDPNFAKEIADENPTLAKAILNSIRNALRMLRQVLATGSIDDETHMNSLFTQLDIFDEAERLWLNAYQQAVANKAAVDIENLQSRIFEEGRGSIPATNTELANQESADIRHSISFNDKSFDELNDDEQRVIHEAVSPDIRFSMPTERDVLPKARYKSDIGFSNAISAISGKQARINALVKNGFSEKQAKQIGEAISNFILDTGNWIEGDLQSEFTFIGWDDLINAEVSVRKDWKGKVVGVSVSAMVANGEYPVNFDLTTICNKREGIMQVIQNLTRIKTDTGKSVLDSVKLTDQDMWNINKALKAEGIDTACLGCFVEARRYYTNRFIASIDNKWNTAVRETRRQLGLPEEEYFNFAHGKKVTGEDYTAISDLWTSYEKSKDTKKSPEQRIRILMNEIIKNNEVDSPYLKLVSASDILTPEGISGLKQISTGKHDLVKTLKSIYGTSAPKEILAFTPYNSEIALLPARLKGQKTDKYLKSIGGIRIQSFSDFKIEHVIDHMQMVADMAARKFTCHAYSKVIAFPRIFGLTGQKINMSVMFDITPAEDWQKMLGCAEEKAKEYAFKYAGLRFVQEKPAENPDNRPYIETELEGVHGYLTYLLGDADYINSVYEEEYQKNLAAGMDENEARRKANEAKPFEQSINYREAVELENQDGYKENVGIIAVAYGNEHLKILLADPNVRYVIPYHKSGLPVFVSEKTSLQYARNYEPVQNTKKADPKEKLQERFNAFKEKYKGEYPAIAFFGDIYENGGSIATTEATATEAAKLHGTGEFDVYKDLDKAKDIKEVANAYLEDCIENNLVPVFSEFAGDPNYYKMLFDFAVTDGTSDHIYPQKTVRNNYPGIDVDAKIAAGEKITEDDYAKLREAIRKGASEENVKNQTRSENMQNVLDDILSKDSENSILAGTNVNALRNSATDYTNPKGVMYSITPEMDEAYMDAVNSGNMDEAQRLVGEAARIAGYNTPTLYHGTPSFGFTTFDLGRGENIIFATSNPLTAETYSGETDRRNISDAPSINVDELYGESLLAEAAKHRGKYKFYQLMSPAEQEKRLHESRLDVKMFASAASTFIDEHRDAFDEEKLAIANRIVDSIDRISTAWADDMVDSAWNDFEDAVWDLKWMDESIQMELTQELQNYGSLLFAKNRVSDFMYAGDIYINKNYESDYVFDNQLALELDADLHKGIYGLYGKSDNQLVIDANGANWNQIIPPDELELYGPQKTRSIAEAAKAKGYDSVLFKNLKDNGGETAYNGISDVYMFFNPNQVKSSDPVTYAEDGSVIPLSERFDPTNNDIRYSLPTQDSDGNILTDGQMEYFKNSQARDSQGRLVPVYHTTNRGGFTVFDPSYSDDKRSLFFASNFDVSQTYGSGYQARERFDLKEITDEASLIDYLTNGHGLSFQVLTNEEFTEIGGDNATWGDINSNLGIPEYEYNVVNQKWASRKNESKSASSLLIESYVEDLQNGAINPEDYVLLLKLPGQDSQFIKKFVAGKTLGALVERLNDSTKGNIQSKSGYYACYLNLENPLIVDAHGANWNRISYDPYGNEAAGITVQDAIEQIESADIADYGIKNIDVEFEYNDDGFPIAVSYDIGLLGIPDEEHWEWTNYVESDSFEPNVEEYTDNGVLDNAELSIAMWAWVEDKLRNYVSDGMIDMMEQTNIDVNGELHYESFNKTGYDFIRGGNIVDVSEFTDNIDDASGKEYTVNTRDLAEIAENYGHDGVIIRNLMDIGGASSLKGGQALSDIYIAFSSNQVKDTRNENPTENPDIRYSFTEEDVMDTLAAADAYDTSYETLENYERMMSEYPDLDVETYFSKNFTEEGVSDFYSALMNEDGLKYEDKVLEEGRVRIATSKDDFYRNVNAKWRESWQTDGQVLKIESVKTAIRKLVIGTMNNSDADKAYKDDVVRKTLIDARTAFQFMKQGRTDVASALLYHSARRMVENLEFVRDDTEFQVYKDIRSFMRNTRVTIDDEYYSDVDYAAFRRENLSRMKLRRGKQNVEDVYSDLYSRWPWIFNDEQREKDGFGDDVPGLLLHIAYVLDKHTTPFMQAYSSEEATELCFDIADQLYDIIEGGREITTIADKLNKSDAKKLDKLYDEMASNEAEYNKSIESLKEQFDQQTKAMKVRHEEAIRKVKANMESEMAEVVSEKDAQIRRLEQQAQNDYLYMKRLIAHEREEKWKKIEEQKGRTAKETERANMWKGRYKERVQKDVQDRKDKSAREKHREKFERVESKYNDLCKWVLEPTKDKYVPEEFRVALAEFLQTLDLQTENSKKLEEKTGHVARKTLNMRQIKDKLNKLAASKTDEDGNYTPGVFEVDAKIAFLLDKLADKLEENGNTIDALDTQDIATIDEFMKLLIRNIQRYKEVKTETKMAELSDIGGRGVEFFKAKIDRDGAYGKYEGPRGTLNTINVASLTPAYLFERMGPLKEMYDVLRHNGFDTYIRNEKMIIDRLSGILGQYYKKNKKNQIMPGSTIEEWRDDRSAKTIELSSGKTVTMSAAQMMSLYCLKKRGEQALTHMMVGGIVVTPIQTGSKIESLKEKSGIKKKAEISEKYVLNFADIDSIIANLTPDQMRVADQLQELMSVDMAKLGNEAHRDLYGYEMFTEDNYFPIKVHGNERPTEINNIGEVVEKIKSFGFTKPLTPSANKALEIDDIFSIVADHCNGMNLYNSYLVPITDFMKVFNYTHTFEDGETLTMKEVIQQAYGEEMLKYILNLMKDINGIKGENRGGLEGIMNEALGKAKRAAVFGNIRVALQQPTAIVRAAAEIDGKYLVPFINVKPEKGTLQEMFEYCPIAQWKSWGYYDTYMGRDIEDVMMNNMSISDTLLAGGYGLLDNLTWGAIWQAVKAEQHDAHPNMDVTSEEFLKLCGRRASDVFDKTQVVDSTFHRSDAMRSKQIATKLFTAFMAEPTLTLNVFRGALFNASEERKAGNKGKSAKIIARAVGVLLIQGAIVSVAQALADAWRDKDPGLPWDDDDDDDEEAGYWGRWWHNFVYNMFDQLHLENNIYLVGDVKPYVDFMMSKATEYWNLNPTLRAFMGWDKEYLYSQNNLIFAALENTAKGVEQAFKKKEKGEDYDKSWYDINQKTASGLGTIIGFPAGTIMRDLHPIWDKVFASAFAASGELFNTNKSNEPTGYAADRSSNKTEKRTTTTEEPSVDIEEEARKYRDGLSDKLSEEQKDKLTDKYKKSLAEDAEKADTKSKDTKSATTESKVNTDAMAAFEYEMEQRSIKAAEAAAGKTGPARDKALWDVIAKGYTKSVNAGNMATIWRMREAFVENGGSEEFFDAQIVDKCKSAYKKTLGNPISEDPGASLRQKTLQEYMLNHGVTQEEISDLCYHSYTASDLKAAMRMGNEDYIMDELVPLVRAGLTREDYEKLYEHRNYGAKYYKGKYSDPKYKQSTGKYVWPINGQITSRFGHRSSPGGVGSTNHMGLDIAGSMGDPIGAADGGKVIFAGWYYGGGNTVMIQHDDGTVTEYMHMSAFNCKVGDTVAQGQQIGQVGSTGNSTGPHCHFGVKTPDGNHVDPLQYLNEN